MKSLTKFFSQVKGKKIENNHGHGARRHVTSSNDDNINRQDKKYLCPMKCEGDKTYDAPGNCPVCNMKLVPVDDNNQNNDDHHGHHHHEHHHGHKH